MKKIFLSAIMVALSTQMAFAQSGRVMPSMGILGCVNEKKIADKNVEVILSMRSDKKLVLNVNKSELIPKKYTETVAQVLGQDSQLPGPIVYMTKSFILSVSQDKSVATFTDKTEGNTKTVMKCNALR